MDLVKKYGMVAFFGVLLITSASMADIGAYLCGLVHGIGMVFLVYGLYKSITLSVGLKKEENQQQENEK